MIEWITNEIWFNWLTKLSCFLTKAKLDSNEIEKIQFDWQKSTIEIYKSYGQSVLDHLRNFVRKNKF